MSEIENNIILLYQLISCFPLLKKEISFIFILYYPREVAESNQHWSTGDRQHYFPENSFGMLKERKKRG